MIYRPVLLVLLIALSAAGCKTVEPFFSKPTVSVEKMALQDMSLFDATALFTLAVENPNPLGINIRKGTYRFTIEDSTMASGTVDEQLRVQAGGAGSIDLPVHVNFADLFSSTAALARSDEVAYRLSGSFDVMGFTIPYETDGKLALPDFPEISLETINITDIRLSGAKINVVLAIMNPNAFAINPAQLEYALDIGDQTLLAGVTESIQGLDKNERVEISMPMEINFVSMGLSAKHLLDGNTAPYRLTGDMRFNIPGGGTKTLPFSRTGEVPLWR